MPEMLKIGNNAREAFRTNLGVMKKYYRAPEAKNVKYSPRSYNNLKNVKYQ
jgi:hypothetical protein